MWGWVNGMSVLLAHYCIIDAFLNLATRYWPIVKSTGGLHMASELNLKFTGVARPRVSTFAFRDSLLRSLSSLSFYQW